MSVRSRLDFQLRSGQSLRDYSGEPAAGSPDGKQIIINAGRKEESDWVFATVRVNADGTAGRNRPFLRKTASRIGPPTVDGS
jgi:hypothetical protein